MRSALLAVILCWWMFFVSSGYAEQLPLAEVSASATWEERLNEIEELLRKVSTHYEQQSQELIRQNMDSRQLEQEIRVHIQAYFIQMSGYSDLLFKSATTSQDVREASQDVREALWKTVSMQRYAAIQRNAISERHESLAQSLEQFQQETDFYDTYLKGVESSFAEYESMSFEDSDLYPIRQQASQKRDEVLRLLETLKTRYLTLTQQLDTFSQKASALQTRLLGRFALLNDRHLFERTNRLEVARNIQAIQHEGSVLFEKFRSLFSRSFYQDIIERTNGAAFFLARQFGLNVIIFLALCVYAYRLIAARFQRLHSEWPWRALILRLFQRSLFLLFLLLVLSLYDQQQFLDLAGQVLRPIVMLWLFTQWSLDVLASQVVRQHLPASPTAFSHLRLFLYVMRYALLSCIVLNWMLGHGSVLVFLISLGLEISLFFIVSRHPEFSIIAFLARQERWSNPFFQNRANWIRPSLIGFGIACEVAGYEQFAHYWFLSWGQTLTLLLWLNILSLALKDWKSRTPGSVTRDNKLFAESAFFSFVFTMSSSRLIWHSFIALNVLMAWGAQDMVWASLRKMLGYSISFGGVSVSLQSLVSAAFILALTNIASFWGKNVLQGYLTKKSSLQRGLQLSLTTLFGYAVWGAGILWSLSAVGIGLKSLSLGVGALGIGLGFALQDIFKNFLSGLILLFERPIEIGDVIEVNQIWGRVEKIRVRFTVVQTFDNATIIIPNTEIISQSLINWTFRDQRVRRTIKVGVAYGSDLNLVKQTLSQIANENPHVLKTPEPIVLFQDFQDSSLLFELRVWTLIDFGVSTDAEIRSEIARLFKARQITIPFPQHDVHLIHGTPSVQETPPVLREDENATMGNGKRTAFGDNS